MPAPLIGVRRAFLYNHQRGATHRDVAGPWRRVAPLSARPWAGRALRATVSSRQRASSVLGWRWERKKVT